MAEPETPTRLEDHPDFDTHYQSKLSGLWEKFRGRIDRAADANNVALGERLIARMNEEAGRQAKVAVRRGEPARVAQAGRSVGLAAPPQQPDASGSGWLDNLPRAQQVQPDNLPASPWRPVTPQDPGDTDRAINPEADWLPGYPVRPWEGDGGMRQNISAQAPAPPPPQDESSAFSNFLNHTIAAFNRLRGRKPDAGNAEQTRSTLRQIEDGALPQNRPTADIGRATTPEMLREIERQDEVRQREARIAGGERGFLAPLSRAPGSPPAQYGAAVPGIVAEPLEAFERAGQKLQTGARPQDVAPEAVTAAGLTVAGGLPAAKPAGSLGTFVGRRWAEDRAATGKVTGQKVLETAELLEANGLPDDFIRRAGKEMIANGDDPVLGDFIRGNDGYWKLEVSDDKMRYARTGPERSTLGREMTHEPLFEGLPGLREALTRRVSGVPEGYEGRFRPGHPEYGVPSTIEVGQSSPQRRSIAAHETQHAASAEEGFARGGSSADFADGGQFAHLRRHGETPGKAVKRLEGEIDALVTEERLYLTPQERRDISVEQTIRQMQARGTLPQGEPIVAFYKNRGQSRPLAANDDAAMSSGRRLREYDEPSAFDQAYEERWHDVAAGAPDEGWLNWQERRAVEGNRRPPPPGYAQIEADRLQNAVARFEDQLRSSGIREPQQIATALELHFGHPFDAKQIAAGEVWWRPKTVKRTSEPGPSAPVKPSGGSVGFALDAEQRAKATALAERGWGVGDIAAALERETDRYVSPAAIASVVENKGVSRAKTFSAQTEDLRRKLSEESFAGMTAKEAAEALGFPFWTIARIRRIFDLPRPSRGNPQYTATAPKIDDVLLIPEIARLSTRDVADVLNTSIGNVQRSRARLQKAGAWDASARGDVKMGLEAKAEGEARRTQAREALARYLDERRGASEDALTTGRNRSPEDEGSTSAFEQASEPAWEGVARSGYARDQFIENREAAPARSPSAAASERLGRQDQLGREADKLAAEVSKAEGELRSQGADASAIATELERRFGDKVGSVDPAAIESGSVWWRLGDPGNAAKTASERGTWKGIAWSQLERETLVRMDAAGASHKEIARAITAISGRPATAATVGNAKQNWGIKGAFERTDRAALWPREANLALYDLNRQDLPREIIADTLAKRFGQSYTSQQIKEQIDRLKLGRHAGQTNVGLGAWQPDALQILRDHVDEAGGFARGFTAEKVAALIEKETGQVVTRNAVVGKAHRLRDERAHAELVEDLAQRGEKLERKPTTLYGSWPQEAFAWLTTEQAKAMSHAKTTEYLQKEFGVAVHSNTVKHLRSSVEALGQSEVMAWLTTPEARALTSAEAMKAIKEKFDVDMSPTTIAKRRQYLKAAGLPVSENDRSQRRSLGDVDDRTMVYGGFY